MLNHIKEHFFSFNTQPPEGGWFYIPSILQVISCFNTQPPEGGWRWHIRLARLRLAFQHTAARRRLVGLAAIATVIKRFNTQPPEGGWSTRSRYATSTTSFNTQPPEGGWQAFELLDEAIIMFQHTAARRRLETNLRLFIGNAVFQHTAARRRLGNSVG